METTLPRIRACIRVRRTGGLRARAPPSLSPRLTSASCAETRWLWTAPTFTHLCIQPARGALGRDRPCAVVGGNGCGALGRCLRSVAPPRRLPARRARGGQAAGRRAAARPSAASNALPSACVQYLDGHAQGVLLSIYTQLAFEYLHSCQACALCDSSRVQKTFHAASWLFLLASTFEISPRSARCTARLHPRIHVRDHARCHAHLCACLAALLRCSWYMDASGRAPFVPCPGNVDRVPCGKKKGTQRSLGGHTNVCTGAGAFWYRLLLTFVRAGPGYHTPSNSSGRRCTHKHTR
jgi:hypothetical protein